MMRTRRSRKTAGPLAVAWVFAGALALSLAQPSEAAAQSECAEYISGGPNNPASGDLIGSKRVTLTIGGEAGVDVEVVSLGVTGSVTETFNVGTYRMDDGYPKEFRCDDYTEWEIQ